jgi:hypothetical protein
MGQGRRGGRGKLCYRSVCQLAVWVPQLSATSLVEPVLFPCMIAVGQSLLLDTKDAALRFWIKGHLHGNRFLLRYGASERLRVSFVIDRSGRYRQVRHVTVRRRWGRALAWLYDFVLSECEIVTGEVVSNADLLERLETLRGNSSFRRGRNLQRFLREQPPMEMFSATTFRAFWEKHGPALHESEWAKQYP